MRYVIEGAEARSGKEVRVTIEAPTAADAERRANANGIFVARTHLVAMSEAATVKTAPVLSYQRTDPSHPAYKLFSPQAAVVATFFGSPLAGATILAMNFCRLGRKSAATTAFVAGLAATMVLIGVGMALPRGFPGVVFAFVPLMIMKLIATKSQGQDVDRHVNRGGDIISNWAAAGIGLGILAAIFAVVLGIVMLIG